MIFVTCSGSKRKEKDVMSFFNDAQIRGMETGEYPCEKCGSLMRFEDEEWRDTLVCPECGYSISLDRYGYTDEEFTALYPTEEELEN